MRYMISTVLLAQMVSHTGRRSRPIQIYNKKALRTYAKKAGATVIVNITSCK